MKPTIWLGPMVDMTPSLMVTSILRPEPVRIRLGGFACRIDCFDMRLHELTQVGQLRLVALAPEQLAAKLVLELADRFGQRRLSYVAGFGGAGEVQRLANRQKVSDLVHFHSRSLTFSRHNVTHL